MATQVKSNLFALLNQLERQNNRRYTYTELGTALGISYQSAKASLKQKDDPNSYLRYGLIGKLLDFFKSQGMFITVGDLYITVDIDKEESEL